MFTIHKDIHFCYGHRLLRYEGKCRHLHGHNAICRVELSAQSLNDLGMVTDFSDIGDFVKDWLNQHIDHKMLLCRDDPLLPALQAAGEPVWVMELNPTAENIARMIFLQVQSAGYPVTSVQLFETPTAVACYHL